MTWLYQVASYYGLSPVITSTDRSYADQQRLYDAYLARGRTGLPAAPPGQSKHERGEAFDMTVTPAIYQPWLGSVWQSIGGIWGGTFSHPDPVHFEAP